MSKKTLSDRPEPSRPGGMRGAPIRVRERWGGNGEEGMDGRPFVCVCVNVRWMRRTHGRPRPARQAGAADEMNPVHTYASLLAGLYLSVFPSVTDRFGVPHSLTHSLIRQPCLLPACQCVSVCCWVCA